MRAVKMLVLAAGAVLAGFGAMPQAHAAGCVSGAVAGGVVGHVAGHHGLAGAAVGCAVGHHEAVKHARQAAQANQPQNSQH